MVTEWAEIEDCRIHSPRKLLGYKDRIVQILWIQYQDSKQTNSCNSSNFARNCTHKSFPSRRPPRGLVAISSLNSAQVFEPSWNRGRDDFPGAAEAGVDWAGGAAACGFGGGASSGSWTGARPPSFLSTAVRLRLVFWYEMMRIVWRGGVLPSCEGKNHGWSFT
jgi:hypothetical protein